MIRTTEAQASECAKPSSWIVGFRIGFFLATRQIRNASLWTTGLIIFIMTLTFLNLTVVSGILVGLVEGSSRAYRLHYSGDILVKNLPNKRFIENSRSLREALLADGRVVAATERLLEGVRIEEKDVQVRKGEIPDHVGAALAAIDPESEDRVTGLSRRVVSGRYLDRGDMGVLLGDGILARYARGAPGDETLQNVDVGSTVRLVFSDGSAVETKVLGVVTSKINEVNRRAYIASSFGQKIIAGPSLNASEIAAVLEPGNSPEDVVEDLKRNGFGDDAHVMTWIESQGTFFKDISATFAVLGNVIGGIALSVSSVTVFIVIFINAVTRRKYIGILKAIGVRASVIECSYLFISFFYVLVGTMVGYVLLYALIKPYFDAHPINFPFSDGVLVAPLKVTLIRTALLGMATLLAGYIPSRMLVKQRTLDALLNR